MKILAAAFAILTLSATAFAQNEITIDLNNLNAAEQLFLENVDEDALKAMGIDIDEAKKFLADLKKGFEGTYIYDLAALRQTAIKFLPLLEQYEETEPYAVWLKTHLDYFEVAEKLKVAATRVATNKTTLPPPAPSVKRKAWVEVFEQRPTPDLAFKQVLPLKKIFIAERVPPELVWLAEVESSFNVKAKSPAGAAGLFQLMPATARSLNLSVGLLRDERLHPEKNARAAAHYLAQLYKRFGDWRLTLAAYNAGEGRVAELLRKNKARTFDEIAHRLPSETQLYVPKVEAVVMKREGRALSDLRIPKV